MIEATPPRGQRGTRVEEVTKVDSFTITTKCADSCEAPVSGGKIVKETQPRGGDDVDKQFGACAPKVPNAPPCET